MNHLPPLQWRPIDDLSTDWQKMASAELPALVTVWKEQTAELQRSKAFQVFQERLRRKIAIETGVIERLYTIDRGITQLLIEQGIDAALIPHGSTDKPVEEVVALIRDHEAAVEGLYDFVKQQRFLSTSYIKELHQFLTRNQVDAEAIDQFGNRFRVPIEPGVWKRNPNNPLRPDGEVHEYCPPIHVDGEMDKLVEWHNQHRHTGVPPEVEAAWLHHRFTQIHPFQDGNGRVARCLASLVFIRAGWFPLIVTRIDRSTDEVDYDRALYIDALEKADHDDLQALVDLFARRQKQSFVSALGIAEQVLAEGAGVSRIIAHVADSLKARKSKQLAQARASAEEYAARLHAIAEERLREVATEIREGLRGVIRQPQVYIVSHLDSAEKRSYYRLQVIEAAKQLEYYANQDYHSWIVLPIRLNGSEDESYAEILLSFHVLGREYLGLLACAASAYWKDPSEEEGAGRTTRQIQALTDSPFQFSYADEINNLESRFRTWLEDAIISGLDYWRKGL